MTIHRQPNRTRRANPDQLTLAGEYRGFLKRKPPSATGNPHAPKFEGGCTLNGESYWISGWVDKRGSKPVLRLVFQLADAVGTEPYQFMPDDLRLQMGERGKQI